MIVCRNQHQAKDYIYCISPWNIVFKILLIKIKNQGSQVCSDKLKDSDTCKILKC